MQRRVELGLALICVRIPLTFAPSSAKSDEQRGFVIVKTNRARWHAIGKIGQSPLKIAPPFRALHEHYPIENLQEPLAEGSSPVIRQCPNSGSIRVRSATPSRT